MRTAIILDLIGTAIVLFAAIPLLTIVASRGSSQPRWVGWQIFLWFFLAWTIESNNWSQSHSLAEESMKLYVFGTALIPQIIFIIVMYVLAKRATSEYPKRIAKRNAEEAARFEKVNAENWRKYKEYLLSLGPVVWAGYFYRHASESWSCGWTWPRLARVPRRR